MDVKEIEKMLKDKNINPQMKKELEEKKRILTENKTVEK